MTADHATPFQEGQGSLLIWLLLFAPPEGAAADFHGCRLATPDGTLAYGRGDMLALVDAKALTVTIAGTGRGASTRGTVALTGAGRAAARAALAVWLDPIRPAEGPARAAA